MNTWAVRIMGTTRTWQVLQSLCDHHGIDKNWRAWKTPQYREALRHPLAQAGYKSGMDALRACFACLLLLPCGRSASWEFGYAAGTGKRCAVVNAWDMQTFGEPSDPDLMYAGAEILDDRFHLRDWADALHTV